MAFGMGKTENIYLIGVPRRHAKSVEDVAVAALRVGRAELRFQAHVGIAIIGSQGFWVIPELGIGGEAVGKSGIVVKIDFTRRDIRRIITEELPATIYHELTHLVRERALGTGSTLLDAFVSEGMACFVEQSLCPKRKIPYVAKIKNEKRVWEEALPILLQKKYDHAEWFFGTKAIPRWAGYRLGYLIVSTFTAKEPTSLSRLVRMRSKDIFAGSDIRFEAAHP